MDTYVYSCILRAADDVNNLFVARLKSATKGEQALIKTLASLGGDNPVRRGDLAVAMGRTTHGISGVRSRLIDKAVITEEERGYIQFTLPGFAEYVLNEFQ